MNKMSVVLDVSYGDCGKGRVVDALIKKDEKSLVVRFSGGHQAGHNVRHGDLSHIFSNISSGTFKGADTLWDEHCTFYPITFLNEYNTLSEKIDLTDINIFIDENSKICTVYDVLINQQNERIDSNGSCGLGFGHTMYRHETEDHSYHIYARDLKYPWILKQKLLSIRKKFAQGKLNSELQYPVHGLKWLIDLEELYDDYCQQIIELKNVHIISTSDKNLLLFDNMYDHIIFEGSQGILLDRSVGVAFPNVTRSYTTMKNIVPYLERYIHNNCIPNIYYVSRCYQTRHGHGPLLGEGTVDMNQYFNFNSETNHFNQWQGPFRYAPISFDMIEYAIRCNRSVSQLNIFGVLNEHIVYTCIDQYKDSPVEDHHTKIIPMCMGDTECSENLSTIFPSIELLLIHNTPLGIHPKNIWFSNSNSESELYQIVFKF